MEYELVVRKSWMIFWAHILLDILILIAILIVGFRWELNAYGWFFPILSCFIGYLVLRDFWYQSSSYLAFTEDGVLYHRGIITNNSKEIPYDNIDKVEVKQAVTGRFFNFGDIIVYTGSDQPDIRFVRADRPQTFKKHLYKKI